MIPRRCANRGAAYYRDEIDKILIARRGSLILTMKLKHGCYFVGDVVDQRVSAVSVLDNLRNRHNSERRYVFRIARHSQVGANEIDVERSPLRCSHVSHDSQAPPNPCVG
jgi:hypothetical protein